MKKIFLSLISLAVACGINAQTVKIMQGSTVVATYDDSEYSTVVFEEETVPESETTSGAFSVSATEQIQFAPANLQYQAGTNTWRFAEHQYDTIGVANDNISTSYSGWIDLFGWGTGNDPAQNDTESSENPTFTDWGTNPILNGNYLTAPNTWRTLTKAEWIYIFYTRTNAATLFGMASVNGLNGLILLPDNWTTPAGLTFHSATSQGYIDFGTYFYDCTDDPSFDNTYTIAQWKQMEDNGAVFLPAAGSRYTGTDYVGRWGCYWSSTSIDATNSCAVEFSREYIRPQEGDYRGNGQSVRLARNL